MQNINMNKLIVILVLGALSVCLVPASAKTQEVQDWQVSTMQGSGSSYASQVTPVGASSIDGTASDNTADSFNWHGNPRRSIELNEEFEDNDTASPVGDAVLPLLMMAAAFGGVTYLRRRKQVVVVE